MLILEGVERPTASRPAFPSSKGHDDALVSQMIGSKEESSPFLRSRIPDQPLGGKVRRLSCGLHFSIHDYETVDLVLRVYNRGKHKPSIALFEA